MSDFRVCVLNGLIAKAPLGDNFNCSHMPYGKGILLELLPRKIKGRGSQCSVIWPKVDCSIKPCGQRLQVIPQHPT